MTLNEINELLMDLANRIDRIEHSLHLMKDVMTLREAAKFLGGYNVNIYKLTDGEIPQIKSYSPDGRKRFIKREDLEAYILRDTPLTKPD